MVLNTIRLQNFRNYQDSFFSLHEGVNIICGENAQGKTNFLEAVSYLSCVRSFRTLYKKELIGFGEQTLRVEAQLISRNREFDVEINLSGTRSPVIYVNKVKLKRNFELAGLLKSVLFSPDDLYLVKGGASERRRFLDIALTQLRPQYANLITEYNKLLEHKTRILKDSEWKPALLDTLDDFSFRMMKIGAMIIKYRAEFVALLSPEAETVHFGASGQRERLSVAYKTVRSVSKPTNDIKTIEKELLDHYAAHRQAEIQSKSCLSGPHKDDIELLIDDFPARTYASQGQTRTVALSLKLAERELFFRDCGEYPLLLLDDVLSELDTKRQDFVLNKIHGGQVIITCCEDEKPAKVLSGRLFTIHKGAIKCMRELKTE
ncbi:MAG: DNA replication/repair protein RecF [Clostridiales bacterium]|nr:DNA replication/repair protein RecF [Clostridiales bacterium]